jgi:hypothetical protein
MKILIAIAKVWLTLLCVGAIVAIGLAMYENAVGMMVISGIIITIIAVIILMDDNHRGYYDEDDDSHGF